MNSYSYNRASKNSDAILYDRHEAVYGKLSVTEGEVKTRRPPSNFFRVAAIVLFIVAAALLIALIILTLQRSPGSGSNSPACLTPECFEAATTIGAKMNFSADPCNDFFNYACGGWTSRHEIPDDETDWGLFDVLGKETHEVVQKMLEENFEDENDEESLDFKVKTLYRQCLDVKRMEEDGTKNLETAISDVGGWAMDGARNKSVWSESAWDFDAALTVANLKYQVYALLWFYIGSDDQEPTVNRLKIYPGGLGLLDTEDYRDANSTKCVAYRNLVTKLASLLGLEAEKATEFSDDVWEFETKLANITPLPHDEESLDPRKSYNKMSLVHLKTNYSYIDWTLFLSNFTNLNDDADMILMKKSYFLKLKSLMTSMPKKSLNNYIVSRLIQESARFLPEKFRQALEHFYFVSLGVKPKKRGHACTRYLQSSTPAGVAIGGAYVKRHFPPESKENVQNMIEDIKTVFKEHVDYLDWMDESTKKQAKRKADAIIQHIGYPDFVIDDSKLRDFFKHWVVRSGDSLFETHLNSAVYHIKKYNRILNETHKRDTWEGNAAQVNAFYWSTRNSIMFPAGILQKPFYHLELPMYFNFAAIGTVIGHEISHAFDDGGANYDLDGKMKKWWSEESWKRFKEKTKCFADYFSKYQVQGIKVRGELTLGENIADTGGLGLSFDAYQKWVKRRISAGGSAESELPGVPLNIDQAFFVSYGQVWCGKIRQPELEKMIKTDPHSPGLVRTIGPPSLLPQFQKAFQCETGTQMAPENRCSIW